LKLPSQVQFADAKVKRAFEKLKDGDVDDKQLRKFLIQAFENIETDCFCGIQIPKKLIPKEYKIKNLWKYNLPNAWRLLYTIEGSKVVVFAILLEWLNHTDYERRFKY